MANTSSTDPTLAKLDPHDWKTGDEPMTAAQRSYLETLSREAGEEFDAGTQLTKAEAALRIEALQKQTGRGGAGGANPSSTARNGG